jgi:hypothetical protein
MIRFLSVAVLALALSLAGCSSGGNVEAPKAPAADAAKSGCKCGDKPQGSRSDCACKDKAKTDAPVCKSCDKPATEGCCPVGTGETKTPAAEKK